MRLEYYHDPKGNFGDDLNPWIWNRLLPGMLDGADDRLLIGIGTILERWFIDKLPPTGTRFVLGAGGGMELPFPTFDERWRIFGVRGPLTARYLGLAPELAITDPAMCLAYLWPERPQARRGTGFMPHHTSVDRWNWRRMCEELGLIYLDPRADPLETVARIAGLERLFAEAMHGAIVADALRVPWRAVRINGDNYTGKWDDWASTLSLPVYFLRLTSLYDPGLGAPLKRRLRALARSAVGRDERRSNGADLDDVRRQLRKAMASDRWYLSQDRDLDAALSRFRQALETMRTALSSGA